MKKGILPLLALILISLISACSQQDTEVNIEDDILWYLQPAQSWEEALPLGNGRLGVMVFGSASNERIQLNDDSLWPGDPGWEEPEGNSLDLDKIRELLFKGDNVEADRLFVEKFSNKSIIRSHQTLGDLYLDFDHRNITDYRRELNLSKAVSTVSYKSNGFLVTEKVFVSNPDRVIVIEFSSEAPDGLSGKVRLTRPDDKGYPTVSVNTSDDKVLIMRGEVTQRDGMFSSKPAPILKGVKFETRLKINNEGGIIETGADYLELKNVRKATLYIVSNSSFYNNDFSEQNRKDLEHIDSNSLDVLEKAHILDYKSLYSRLTLKLSDKSMDTIPTDVRLEMMKKDSVDLGMEALLFQYGRYLLISSSREGTNPANLQGLWNQHIAAPWNADYHLNINLQMNYWLANPTNLDELNGPLFDYIDRLVENGKITATRNFGCRGAFIPHATDLWAPTWLRAPTAYWGCSVGAGGWLMQHYWQHFEFTCDTLFLKERAYPAIREVALFYSDWLIEDKRDGTLISAPSTSPENSFINSKGNSVASCLGSAMDQQIIEEVFSNYIAACKILKINDELLDRIVMQRDRLRPGLVIGSDGRILEWDREYSEPEPGHRHMSHLYAFYPGNKVSADSTPEIFAAVRKTLDYRLENGGAGTGWSRAWLISCSARLLDGDMAHKHIQLLFKKSMYSNLFDAHPPFQIDGNFGYTAAVSEMLLQSHEHDIIRILPALPPDWSEGYVTGLKARGGLTIDIFWSKARLEKLIIRSKFRKRINMIYGGISIPIDLDSGESYTYRPAK